MEALIVILIFIVGLGVFDVSSLRWGTDSRPRLSDDHAR
jgi:hypothetical protein